MWVWFRWNNQDVANTDEFIEHFKQTVKDMYIQTWHSDVTECSKLDKYNNFKTIFNYEQYLSDMKDDRFRIALCQLRTSSHHLRIEDDRKLNVPRHQRLCRYCDLGLIEDEYHFCLVCPLYDDLRRKYLPLYCYNNHSPIKFIQLMQSNNQCISQVGQYVFYAFKRRESTQERI